ncbi:hypothetical protein B0H10DRAFT_2436887 [Mycena sp. CBHHK59/15]|nr:hypothetical protein B0H10DRAFT_2436887 [Mycena sp. CBHHK59/15]
MMGHFGYLGHLDPINIYRSAYTHSHAHLFLDNNWIDVAQLKQCLKNMGHDVPTASPAAESSTTLAKLEHDTVSP